MQGRLCLYIYIYRYLRSCRGGSAFKGFNSVQKVPWNKTSTREKKKVKILGNGTKQSLEEKN